MTVSINQQLLAPSEENDHIFQEHDLSSYLYSRDMLVLVADEVGGFLLSVPTYRILVESPIPFMLQIPSEELPESIPHGYL